MTIASTADLDTAVATYVPELAEAARRSDLVDLLSHHRRDRRRVYGGAHQRSRAARRLLAPLVDPSGSQPTQDRHEVRDTRFIRLTRDLVRVWVRPVSRQLQGHPALADAEKFLDQCLEDQVALASETLVRTLVEVLAERRHAGQLTGDTPESRFDHFRAWIGSAEGADYLARRYPAAVIRAHALVSRRSQSTREIIERFVRDLPDLRSAFPFLDGDVRIHALKPGAGDTHDGGRTVGVLDLGRHGRLVYKPRNLAPDQAFHRLGGSLNEALGTSLRVPATLTREHHGWAEFVDGAGTTAMDDADYPYRLGELGAVLYLLRSTDMHYENIVTDAEGRPVVVDAETIMTPAPVRAPTYADDAGSWHARRFLEESVIGIGLLPLRVSVPGRTASLDIGASGSITPGQVSPFRNLSVRHIGRDDMHIALEPGRTGSGNANPNAGSSLESIVAFRDGVRQGLEDTLRRLRSQQSLVAALIREQFAGVRLRHVNIPTVFYAQLLRMCSHPALLEDPDAHLAVLGRVCLRNGAGQSATTHEVAQMLGDDVPLFTVDAHGTDLLDGRGRMLTSGYFEASPVDRALARLHSVDEQEIQRQVELVNVAFIPRLPDGGERTPRLARAEAGATPRRSRKATLGSTAATAVDRILSRWVPATDDSHPGTFWGPVVTTSDAAQWTPGSLGYDVYGGSVGVALALAEAGNLLDLTRAREAAAGVVDPIRAQILSGALESQLVSVGGMTGMGGTVWAIAACDRLLGTGTADHARLINALSATVRPGIVPEFTAGLAGALAAACGVVERTDDAHRDVAAAALADLAGRVLPGLEDEAARAHSASSPRHARRDPTFTGYAHGLAGMVAPAHRATRALSRTAPALSARLAAVGRSLLTLLLRQIGADGALPRTVGGTDFSWAWCHGAPGVLLGLLDAAKLGADVPESVLLALGEQTRTHGVGNNPTYCHGDLGSLEALHRLAVHMHDGAAQRRWVAETEARASTTALRDHASARDRYAGSDSLMVGRAGGLHALLRNTDPHRCPDVLTLG